MIDVLASAPHYADHLAAVFGALPDDARGSFMTSDPVTADRVRSLGHEASEPVPADRPTLVASYGDLKRATRLGRRRLAIMEHGAGQSYGGRRVRHGSYAGGQGRGAASLFLHPGEHPATRDRSAYPSAQVAVVGSPVLDTLPHRQGEPGRVVAFSFHFNGGIAPETRNAYPWAFPTLVGLRDRFDLIAHAHPRFWPLARKHYAKVGIEAVGDFDEVCRRADVYVCDNSSTLFAFATTGRPVVVLNPPWYDRRIDHGLRFWDAASVGVQCDRPEDIGAAIERALSLRPDDVGRREEALDMVYAYRSGAAQRAADALLEWAA